MHRGAHRQAKFMINALKETYQKYTIFLKINFYVFAHPS